MMISFSDVSFSYDDRQQVLDGCDLEIRDGLTLLVGPNGCGKSTLLKLAAGVERPGRGSVQVGGHDLWREEIAAREGLAYVPEQPDLTPYATVREVMRLVCDLRGEPPARATQTLEAVGLTARADHSIRELSMGQRRRAVLAAAMIGNPRTLLLDEPLDAMDRTMRDGVLAWVENHRRDGSLIVIVTHDIEPFVEAAARVISVWQAKPSTVDPLPVDSAARLSLVERLARGEHTSKM